jgi:hypothetical protein
MRKETESLAIRKEPHVGQPMTTHLEATLKWTGCVLDRWTWIDTVGAVDSGRLVPMKVPHRHPSPMATVLACCLALTLPGVAAEPAASQTSADNSAGAKGAKTYCFMRAAGNTHKVSWDAAYALIKRQSAALFKTSPEHGAVMITEAVVNDPTAYPDCGKYLGDLYVK